jgi:hypothetical protein
MYGYPIAHYNRNVINWIAWIFGRLS